MTQIMAAAWLCRTSMAFVARELSGTGSRMATISASRMLASPVQSTRLFSVSSDIEADAKSGVSRIETLQAMLSKHGAPGSEGCSSPHDLEPVFFPAFSSSEDDNETPELVADIISLASPRTITLANCSWLIIRWTIQGLSRVGLFLRKCG